MKPLFTKFLFTVFISSLLICSCTHSLLQKDHHSSTKFTDHSLQVKDPLRVLLLSGTGWYRHPEIPIINGWLVRIRAQHGMQIDVSETGADLSEKTLKNYDVLLPMFWTRCLMKLNEQPSRIGIKQVVVWLLCMLY